MRNIALNEIKKLNQIKLAVHDEVEEVTIYTPMGHPIIKQIRTGKQTVNQDMKRIISERIEFWSRYLI